MKVSRSSSERNKAESAVASHRWMVLFCMICIAFGAQSASAQEYWVNFEDSHDPGGREQVGGEILVVDNPLKDATNSSDKVARCRIFPQGLRAEYSSPRLDTNEQKYSYRWMYYLPDDFNLAPLQWRCLSQWQTYPCEACSPPDSAYICDGCEGVFDDLSIVHEPLPGDNNFRVRWRAKPDCREFRMPSILGRWVSFRMDIYWTNTSNGWTQLWVDDAMVEEHSGIKTLFDGFPSDGHCNMYWSVGLYGLSTAPLGGDSVDVYIDNISITSLAVTQAPAAPNEAASSPLLVSTGSARTVKIWVAGSSRAEAIVVRDIQGRLVRHLELPAAPWDGTVSVTWDGRNSVGRPAPAGVYIISAGESSVKGVLMN